MRRGHTAARLAVARDVAFLLATLVGVVAFLVVGGTLVWAMSGTSSACREAAVPTPGPADDVYTAGWDWGPVGMRCVVARKDGPTDMFVVTPW